MGSDEITRGGGPENTPYDRQRHEKMRLRPIGRFFGLTMVGLKAIEYRPVCIVCTREISTPHVVVFGNHYHEICYNSVT